MRKTAVVLGLFLLVGWPSTQAQITVTPLYTALSRVPDQAWQTITYSDVAGSMTAFGTEWPPTEGGATEEQSTVLASIWQPQISNATLSNLGFTVNQVNHVTRAEQDDQFILWLEGNFDPNQIAKRLQTAFYTPLADFPAESYQAVATNAWRQLVPYIALPSNNHILITSSETLLLALLNIHDGRRASLIEDNELMTELSEANATMTSALLRFDHPPSNCPIEDSAVVVHGQRYNADDGLWEYLLNIGYDNQTPEWDIDDLAETLEYSIYANEFYSGVLGQHTALQDARPYPANRSRIMQFRLSLAPTLEQLPFEIGTEPDSCQFFRAPPAASADLAVTYVPDISARRVDGIIRYGNVEQALYNAGMSPGDMDNLNDLTMTQAAAQNGTWRTDLVTEGDFEAWFGFPANSIAQVIEFSIQNGEYIRILWGDFDVTATEAALRDTGYVALEQYFGTRVFELRNPPDVGGIFLSRLVREAAAPEDGVLVFANNLTNIRLALDIFKERVSPSMLRSPELLLMASAVEDATNVTLRRFANPQSSGLICGILPYNVEAFANVLRPDGWHFIYGLGTSSTVLNVNEALETLSETLENSDYPMQGPGSFTFGERSTVIDARVVAEGTSTMLMVELQVTGNDQEASFFGQDLAQAALPPCALGG